MLKHVVAQGECLQSIARRFGFADGKTIWNHSLNEQLRRRRLSQHVLAPGDVVFIPDRMDKVVSCATGRSHAFQVRLATRDVHIVLRDAARAPIAGAEYRLRVGGDERQGKTGSDGAIHERGFRPDIDRGELELTELNMKKTILIGHLDPHNEDSGWRQRLENLGYAGDEEGLTEFARDHDLPADADAEKIHQALYEQA